jgi:membrane-associated phospholipid phosphatase
LKNTPPLVKWLTFFGSVSLIGVLFWMLNNAEMVVNSRTICFGMRGGIVFFSMIGWFTSQSLISARSMKSDFIGDGVHELTASLHGYLASHPRQANGVLIVSSALIDALGIFLFLASVFGPTMQPLAALIILFLLRQVCQGFCALPVPPGMIWRDPGFPSLLVTYEVANDFFFSGHTAIAALAAIEAARLFPWWAGAAVAIIAVGEACTVLILRAHYTLDVIAAVFAAFCAAGLADWLAKLFSLGS